MKDVLKFVLEFHVQHKTVLDRQLPENLKLAIAKRIESSLFVKVDLFNIILPNRFCYSIIREGLMPSKLRGE
jgi:hypothetical protein